MGKIGIYYGSQTGTTASVAEKIAERLGVDKDDIHDVAKSSPSSVADYDILLLGTSTWGDGELEDDWFDFVAGLEELMLDGKKIALFGCGDESMEDTFCSGVGELYEKLKNTGATFIGDFNTIGYTFKHSKAKPDNRIEAYGLLLDEVNHQDLTDKRIDDWVELLKKEI